MHKHLTQFLNLTNQFYDKQFGFRHGHSTMHALLEITEKMRQAHDAGKYSCGVLLDLQKAFDTVNHCILLKKLEHYSIRGITNKWFNSFLTDQTQFTTVQGKHSDKNPVYYGVSQGSVLGPLLFILFINDFHAAIEFSSVHHFADDTNLLSEHSLKKLNQHINRDLKLAVEWLRANKLSLNISKTELVILKSQNILLFKKILKLHDKAIQIINLKTPNTPVGPLLKDNKILKISDFINYKNAMLVKSILRKETLAIFNEMFLTKTITIIKELQRITFLILQKY